MRIAQISTVSAAVKRDSHGSVESLVWLLTHELVRRGHDVTVFGTADSDSAGELVPSLPGAYGSAGAFYDWQLCEWVNLCRAVEQSGRFDVLHSHAYLWGIPLRLLSRAPMVHTLHIVPEPDVARLWELAPESCVTAISRHQWSAHPHLRPAAIIPHAVDTGQFALNEKPEDYVCYLGRFTSGKGPCQAVVAAREVGMRLVMAGPRSEYFQQRVRPLVDGTSVQYAGVVRGAERNQLLGGARALLYPIQYPESFGLVLVEAMLCGTPVVALRVGAVPEIVEEGVTGCMATSLEDFPKAIMRCLALDRRRVRARAEERFSVARMIEAYLRVYEQAIRAREAA